MNGVKSSKIKFTEKKCLTVEMSKSENRPCGVYKIGGIVINTVKEEKDLRITTQDTLTPEKPINKICEGTFSLQAKY